MTRVERRLTFGRAAELRAALRWIASSWREPAGMASAWEQDRPRHPRRPPDDPERADRRQGHAS